MKMVKYHYGKYAEYVVDVSSEKGTPDVISMNDVLKAGRMSVDTSKFTYTITKNGQPAGNEYTAAVVADENNDDNNHNYTLSATLQEKAVRLHINIIMIHHFAIMLRRHRL